MGRTFFSELVAMMAACVSLNGQWFLHFKRTNVEYNPNELQSGVRACVYCEVEDLFYWFIVLEFDRIHIIIHTYFVVLYLNLLLSSS